MNFYISMGKQHDHKSNTYAYKSHHRMGSMLLYGIGKQERILSSFRFLEMAISKASFLDSVSLSFCLQISNNKDWVLASLTLHYIIVLELMIVMPPKKMHTSEFLRVFFSLFIPISCIGIVFPIILHICN